MSASRFLRLKTVVINTAHINKITIKPHMYYIHMNRPYNNGFMLLGGGGFNTDYDRFDICKKNDPEEYHIVSNWLNEACAGKPIGATD